RARDVRELVRGRRRDGNARPLAERRLGRASGMAGLGGRARSGRCLGALPAAARGDRAVEVALELQLAGAAARRRCAGADRPARSGRAVRDAKPQRLPAEPARDDVAGLQRAERERPRLAALEDDVLSRAGVGGRTHLDRRRHGRRDRRRGSALEQQRGQDEERREVVHIRNLRRGDVAEAVAQVVQPLVPVGRQRGDALHRAAGELDELVRRDPVRLRPVTILVRQLVRRLAGGGGHELGRADRGLRRLVARALARGVERLRERLPVQCVGHHGSYSTWSKKRSTVWPGRTLPCSARSSSSVASPSARLTASQGRLKFSWIIIVEIRGLISITFSPMNWMLKNHSSPNSSTIRAEAATSSGASSVTKNMPRPQRTDSRVRVAWRTIRRPSAIPSTVRSGSVRNSMTRRSRPSSGSSSTASSSVIASAPGLSFRSWWVRSTVGSRTRNPREPEEKTGLKQTGLSG